MFAFGRKKEKSLKTEGSIISAGSTAEKESKEEKERRKREKKEAKKAAKQGHSSFYGIGGSRSSDSLSIGSGSLTADELKRLDEVRRSFRLDNNDHPPELPPKNRNQNSQHLSGITADYRDVNQYSPPGGDENSETSSTTSSATSSLPRSASSTSGNFPPPLPKTKPSKSSLKKGILKGSRKNYDVTKSNSGDLDSSGLLLRNTKDNEYANVYRKSVFLGLAPDSTADEGLTNGKKSGGSSAVTPESEFADREVSYDEVSAVTAQVRIHSNHLSPVSPIGLLTKSEDVTDSVFSMDELTNSGLLTGECTGTGIVSVRGTKRERPLSTSFPLDMPGLNKKFQAQNSTDISNTPNSSSNDASDSRQIILERFQNITEKENNEKPSMKCEDYGFQVFNVGIGKEIKLQIEPTKQYFDHIDDTQSFENNKLLLPGDQLICINGTEIKSEQSETKHRKRERSGNPRADPKDQVLNIIRASEVKETCNVQVKSLPEFHELRQRFLHELLYKKEDSGRTSTVGKKMRHFPSATHNFIAKAKSEEQLASEKAFLEAERVWLVHRDGFASAGLLKKGKDGEGNEEETSDGKVRVQLDYNGDIIEVDEDDVEKANPPSFDKVEDLAQLRFLNESSVLHTLRQRFGNQLTHTFAGPTIISINPMSPLAIYSDKVIQMFKECKLEDMPPHIYSVAQTAFRAMLHTRRDQSIALVGRSGSGKTTNIRHILNYYATIASSTSLSASSPAPLFTQEKVSALFCLLEAFGNARTVMNSNASRFSQLVSLDFDNSGVIVSVSIQAMMLEKTRVVRRPSGEPNFNIFYQMLAGLDIKQRRDLHLDNLNEPNLFMTPLQRTEDRTKAANAWERIIASTKVLGIHPNEALGLWSVLAAIYHLGVASVSRSNTGKPQFGRAQAAQRASLCLGTTVEDLTRLIFSEGGRRSVSSLSPLNQQTSNRKVKQNDGGNPPDGGMEALEGFVVGLYQEAFNAVLYLINRSITTTNNANTSILLLDTPGFQNAATVLNSGNKNAVFNGASFEDLCHNYTQERLQMLFHDRTITTLHENYLREQIDIDGIIGDGDLATPAPLVSLVDKQVGVRAPGGDAESVEKRGLLWLLDEEAIYPGATDQSFVERLLLQSQDTGRRSSTADRRRQSLSPGNPSAPDRAPIGDNLLLSKGPGESHFILHHFQGTNPVLYNAHGWLQASREDPAVRSASNQLQESNVKFISELFGKSRALGTSSVSGSVAGLEGSHALRRVSSMRRAFTSGAAGIKRHSVALQIKFQVDGICEQLRRTRLHFVHCFIPQHNAGICDIKGASSQTNNATPSNGTLDGNNEILMNVPLVRSQLRGAQILDVVRLHKNGFPENMTFGEFWRKYKVLLESANSLSANLPVDKVRSAVQDLLEELDLDKTAVRLGNTQVFLRSGVLAHLNEERDEKVTDQVVRFQAICRGHLARRRIQKLKTQDIAIRCIQKNVRKFMGVRGWPWWRLLIKITPMLNVHRTEDMLKSKLEELETLRTRLEKVEKERTEFKQTNDKLESRLSEMTADLGEEHSAATLATERLENEQAERMKLQKDNSELQGRSKQLQSANDRMEMELMYSRGMDSMNGGEGYEGLDEGEHASIFKQKYERAAKELDYTKKRLQQQHEDDMEQLVALKKQLEKKLNDAYEEVDEQRQVVAQWKRKTAKVQGEQNDLRMLLEEQTSRNALLEKRARKFDTELGLVNEERKAELQSKEKFQKEVDQLKSIKNSLEDHIQAMKLDLDFKEEKIGALNQELEELSAGGGASEEEVSSLKRQKHDLEMRLKDQEEELDDLAGQVQIFEAAKTKLEMSMAAQKKEHRRELSAKDDELEDARTSTQKKVKVLEQQLESEHEERINFMREKHELETKIINLQELANRSADEEQVAKLKKDLKRTKALLKDAQLMIEKSRNESSNKVVLRQLKNQLEDTEFARMAAVKAKQNVELEVADLQLQLDDVCRNKSDLEDKMLKINREKADMSSQLEDNEEEMSDVMKKYKASVSQLSVDQITIQQQASQVTDLEEERNKLKEQLAEFAQKIESLEGDNVSTAQHQRLELKIKELESKLELEKTTRGRMETQITRLKEGIEKINHECDSLRVKEATSQDQARRLQRQLRDLKENYTTLQQKETEVNAKKNEYEKKLELAEAETVTARNDLKLALKRVEDLQQAINGELDSDLDSLNSDADSDSSDELIGATFMDHHNRAISVQRERESIARDISARESIQREVRASIARDSVVRQLQTMPEEPELKMSEMMSNKRINEGDNDSSSEEDNEDNNTTQQREDAVQKNSIDGTIEESQA